MSAWQERYPDTFRFYPSLSLEAIPKIRHIDVALIDGDHNWFTVFNELTAIENQCRTDGHPFPLIIMHDVAWPYARRDLYYDPATIPEAYRHPYGRDGILPNSPELSQNRGLNRGMCNALTEGGPQNGVLTGIQDFLEHTELDIELLRIPVFNGLGILLPVELMRRNQQLEKVFSNIRPTPEIEALLDAMEKERIQEMIRFRDFKLKKKHRGQAYLKKVLGTSLFKRRGGGDTH